MGLSIWLYVDADTGNPDVQQVPIERTDFNYTHNVTPMWQRAGCYEALYKSEGKPARDVLPALRAAVACMEDEPEAFKALNPPNGWGSYDTALPWLQMLTAAFAQYPKAKIGISP